ncbi:MAG: hypothetical protein KF906_03570 [Actinobacteria bacterium]|nr:hypothetical protein [Actinomycetota bacterium]
MARNDAVDRELERMAPGMPLARAWEENLTRTMFSRHFLGVMTVQNPLDVQITQEIIWETRPEVIVECGSFGGVGAHVGGAHGGVRDRRARRRDRHRGPHGDGEPAVAVGPARAVPARVDGGSGDRRTGDRPRAGQADHGDPGLGSPCRPRASRAGGVRLARDAGVLPDRAGHVDRGAAPRPRAGAHHGRGGVPHR